MIDAVMLGLAFRSPAIDTSRSSVVLVIGGNVLAVYIMASFFVAAGRCGSEKMNLELLRFQRFHEN